jgi:hypothetical protein
MKTSLFLLAVVLPTLVFGAGEKPTKHKTLLPFVQEAPDQGETVACLFMASTGAIELLANKKANIKNPKKFGKYDLSESYVINAVGPVPRGKSRYEEPVYRVDGEAVPAKEWPTVTKTKEGLDDFSVWNWKDSSEMTKVQVPKVETIALFSYGKKFSQNILDQSDIEDIKDALVKHNSPILVNYVDDDYWHVVLIVGFDDKAKGECYEITPEECAQSKGAFYVRDSFGKRYELRDYDWFRVKGNSAFVVKEAP